MQSETTPKAMGADYIHRHDEWETTYDSDMLSELEEDVDLNWFEDKIVRIGLLKRMPDLFMVSLPEAFTEHGDPDGCEVRYFMSEAAARAALDDMAAKADQIRKAAA